MKARDGFLIANSDNSFHFYKGFHHKINAILECENGWQKTSARVEEIVTEMPVERCCG